LLASVTSTAPLLQLQWSLPPDMFLSPGLTPESTEGWTLTLGITTSSGLRILSVGLADRHRRKRYPEGILRILGLGRMGVK
jgi:hypothetical protein